jgi:saccharopine dehydrogenase (NAD+, L-lysine-forming)
VSGRVVLYGATGYSGRLLAERLAAADVDLVLAGRDPAKLAPLAAGLQRPCAAVALGDPAGLDGVLADAAVVLHAAGPFMDTAEPMIAACLRTGTHYLDLAGEWPVFVHAMELSDAAAAAGVMVMPGVGLTIAATDCLMALATERAPGTVKLRVGISWPQVISRGTIESASRLMGPDTLIRRDGRLTPVPGGRLAQPFDFGEGLSPATAFSWADVVTGEFTTGVKDIEIYSEIDWPQRLSYQASSAAMAWTGAAPWRRMVQLSANAWPRSPSAEARRRAGFVMVAEALDSWRRVTRLRMRTIDGYTLSAVTGQAAVQRVLAGEWRPGFQTPAAMFGGDFILGLGCAALDPTA